MYQMKHFLFRWFELEFVYEKPESNSTTIVLQNSSETGNGSDIPPETDDVLVEELEDSKEFVVILRVRQKSHDRFCK